MARRGTFVLVAAVAAACVAVSRLRAFPVRVAGQSMAPTLEPGDCLACVPARRLRRGHVVVARSGGREVVKRVTAVAGDVAWLGGRAVPLEEGEIALEGDNPAASTDSNALGPLRVEEIAGRAVARYRPRPRLL